MNKEVYRRTWLRLHRSYEKKAFVVMRRALRNAALNIPFDKLDQDNYNFNVRFNVLQENIDNAYYQTYLQIGLLHGNRVGKGINKEMKRFDLSSFGDGFRRLLIQFLADQVTNRRIVSVRENLVEYIIDEIKKGIDEGKTMVQISRDIQKLIKSRNFFRWQAMRIARTESTAAANYGATVAAADSGLVLEKIWISSHDARTRRRPDDQFDHYVMDGVRVDKNENFNVQGDPMLFPGDPKARAGNVINCRCTVAMRGKRDANGRLIFNF
jgi:hypothetical protein